MNIKSCTSRIEKQVSDVLVDLLFSPQVSVIHWMVQRKWVELNSTPSRERMNQNTPSIDVLSRNIFSIKKWRKSFHSTINKEKLSQKSSRIFLFELICVGGLEEQRCFLLTTNRKLDIAVYALPENGSNPSQMNVSAESRWTEKSNKNRRQRHEKGYLIFH